jgi:hypothetical protein
MWLDMNRWPGPKRAGLSVDANWKLIIAVTLAILLVLVVIGWLL